MVDNFDRDSHFAEVIAKARSIAEHRLTKLQDDRREPLSREQLTSLVDGLAKEIDLIHRGNVEGFQGQLFGPMKYVIDWGEPNESELLKALYDIELFYRDNY